MNPLSKEFVPGQRPSVPDDRPIITIIKAAFLREVDPKMMIDPIRNGFNVQYGKSIIELDLVQSDALLKGYLYLGFLFKYISSEVYSLLHDSWIELFLRGYSFALRLKAQELLVKSTVRVFFVEEDDAMSIFGFYTALRQFRLTVSCYHYTTSPLWSKATYFCTPIPRSFKNLSTNDIDEMIGSYDMFIQGPVNMVSGVKAQILQSNWRALSCMCVLSDREATTVQSILKTRNSLDVHALEVLTPFGIRYDFREYVIADVELLRVRPQLQRSDGIDGVPQLPHSLSTMPDWNPHDREAPVGIVKIDISNDPHLAGRLAPLKLMKGFGSMLYKLPAIDLQPHECNVPLAPSYLHLTDGTFCEWPERSLFVHELQVLTRMRDVFNYQIHFKEAYILSDGAAPPQGHPSRYNLLASLFPEFRFHLYDIRPIGAVGPNIQLYDTHFSVSDAKWVHANVPSDKNLIVFLGNKVSIRTPEWDGFDDDDMLYTDLMNQLDTVVALAPEYSSLKFELPPFDPPSEDYLTGKKSGQDTFSYFTGELILMPYTTFGSEMLRLFTQTPASNSRENWGLNEIRNRTQLFHQDHRSRYYFHKIVAPGLDHCFDCALEVNAIREYHQENESGSLDTVSILVKRITASLSITNSGIVAHTKRRRPEYQEVIQEYGQLKRKAISVSVTQLQVLPRLDKN